MQTSIKNKFSELFEENYRTGGLIAEDLAKYGRSSGRVIGQFGFQRKAYGRIWWDEFHGGDGMIKYSVAEVVRNDQTFFSVILSEGAVDFKSHLNVSLQIGSKIYTIFERTVDYGNVRTDDTKFYIPIPSAN